MTNKTETEKPHYLGHRERLRERFLKSEGRDMPDYELLELLLTIAIPRKDVKPLAKELIQKAGSYVQLIKSPVEKLQEYGLTRNAATILKIVSATALKFTWETLNDSDAPIISNYDYMIDYCRSALGHLDVEELRIIFLNSKLQIIKESIMQKGTINAVAIHPREVIKEALACGATSLIMFHNHPSGNLRPSQNDIDMTKRILDALKPLSITLHDHLIISQNSYYSFKDHNLI